MTRYFAAINPNTNEIASIRTSKTREYKAAVAIQWPDETADQIGVGSYHGDEALAHKASQQYINRGAYVEVWEVREISKTEHAEARERFKAIIEGRQAQEQAPETETVDPVKAHKLSRPMVRDLVAYINSGEAHITCRDGMTSKALRARGIMAEGEGRTGFLTAEGYQVAQALAG